MEIFNLMSVFEVKDINRLKRLIAVLSTSSLFSRFYSIKHISIFKSFFMMIGIKCSITSHPIILISSEILNDFINPPYIAS